MSSRRTFLTMLLPTLAAAQYQPKPRPGKIKCPLGHTTGRSIDRSLPVATDDPYWGTVGWITSIRLLRCETCNVLFVEILPDSGGAR